MNVKITHADFVVGMQKGTVGCLLGEPYQLLKGARWAIFNLLAVLYTLAPVIIIPLWAYHLGNWWLLAGIVVSYVASRSAEKASRAVFVLACYCIGFWIHNGFSIYHYTTFYFLSALWGYTLYQLADTVRTGCARQSLIESPKLFEEAIAQNKLRIVQLDSSQEAILTAEDIALAVSDNLSDLKPFLTLLVFSNIAAEAFTYVFGLFTGLIGTAMAHAKGIQNLMSEKADSIMRQLKKGTVGFAALTLGYFGPKSIYGIIFAVGYIGAVLWFISTAKKR
jgi:hypothetical protein